MDSSSSVRRRREICLQAAEGRLNSFTKGEGEEGGGGGGRRETEEKNMFYGRNDKQRFFIENIICFFTRKIFSFFSAGRDFGDAGEKGGGGGMKKRKAYIEKTQNRLKIIIGFACCVMLAGGAFQIYKSVYDFIFGGFVAINIQDKQRLKSVFFSGDPWLIYCINPKNKDQSISRVVVESRRSLPEVNFGTLDCTGRLPSSSSSSSSSNEEGKKLSERFGIPEGALGFLVANLKKPKVLNKFNLKDKQTFVDFVKRYVTPSLIVVQTKEEYEKKCINKAAARCLIFGVRGGEKSLHEQTKNVYLPSLLKKNRKLKPLMIDTQNIQVKLDEKILQTKKKSQPSNVNLICVVNNQNKTHAYDEDDEAAEAQPSFLGAFYSGDIYEKDKLASFFNLCTFGTEGGESLVELDFPPEFQKKKKKARKPTEDEQIKKDKKNVEVPQDSQNAHNPFDIQDDYFSGTSDTQSGGNNDDEEEEGEVYIGGPEELRYVGEENADVQSDDDEQILEIEV